MSETNDPQPALVRQDSKASATAAAAVDSRFCCNICLEAVVDPVATLCGHLYCWPCLFRWLEPGMYPAERASLGIMQPYLASDVNRRVCPVCKAHCSIPTLVPIYVRESNEGGHDYSSGTKKESGKKSIQDDSEPKDESYETRNESEDAVGGLERDNNDPTGTSVESQAAALGVSESVAGLRQRIRFRSRDSENSVETVPSRPPANSPRHHSPSSPSSTPPTPQRYRTNSWVAPLTPTGHRGSLTHGLLLSIQQATARNSGVPPLHRRDGVHPTDLDADSRASEYLSRLLLMLSCFVVLCLLLL